MILIDLGATHYFLCKKLIWEFQFPICELGSYNLLLGGDLKEKGNEICHNVQSKMQGLTVIQDFFPLTLGSVDLILGMQWLATLGFWQTTKAMLMRFLADNEVHTLKGEFRLQKASNPFSESKKELKGNNSSMVELH